MPRLIYRAIQTAITFTDTLGDYALTLQNLAADAGRLSAQVDRGVSDQPIRYKWRAVIQWSATPAIGDRLDIYLGENSGLIGPDANLGTSDTSMTDGDASNLERIGTVRSQTAASGTNNIRSGIVTIYDRYFQIGVYNRSTTSASLVNTANASLIILTPVPDEIQIP